MAPATIQRDRPTVAPAGGDGFGRPAMQPPEPDILGPAGSDRPSVAAELALVALTLVPVVGLGRLFTGGSVIGPVAITAVAAHLVAAVLRRRQVAPVVTVPLTLALMLIVVSWVTLLDTTAAGIPTAETLERAVDELRQAWTLFGTEVAPVPGMTGFVLVSAVGTWLLATLADWAAFRLRARFESIVPSLTMFAFEATLGPDGHRLTFAGAYLVALLAYLGIHHTWSEHGDLRWLHGAAGSGHRALARRATGLGAVAIAVGLVVGPALPGVDEPSLIDWRNDDDDRGSRVAVSPLVDIRTRLVDLSQIQVFRVLADEPAYWRLTSLDSFDGRIWSSVGSYREIDGGLDGSRPNAVPARTVLQDFFIDGLATIWLPAAFEPTALLAGGEGVRYDRRSGSLLTERDTAQGLAYRLESAVPSIDAALAASAPGTDGVDDAYRALPAGFSPATIDLARNLTAGAATPYEQALRLQQFFRTEFTYSLNVRPGHGSDAIEDFLFRTREGYCEQFAGSFAAMARAIGLPARVAVGFTPGVLESDGLYHVRGEHAHAWPELWFEGVGWVAFEPTPGRGAPGGESYTGVPPQQAATGDPGSATTLPASPTTTPGATQPPEGGPEATASTLPPLPGSEPEGPSTEPRSLPVALVVALVVAGVVLSGLGAGAAVNWLRRRSRWLGATTPAAQVAVAWTETLELLARAGLPLRAGDTHAELASRAGRQREIDGAALARLATLTQDSAFGPEEPAPPVAVAAKEAATAVATSIRQATPRGRRLRWAVDPRPVEAVGVGSD